jgi:predicted transcriptional regulator
VRGLGELEAEVMAAVWARGATVTVREVHGDLSGQRTLAYTTVMTVMDNLHRKGLLRRAMDGRAWRYEAILSRAEYSAQLMRDILAAADDHAGVLAQFVAAMTPEETQQLRDVLRQRPRRSP